LKGLVKRLRNDEIDLEEVLGELLSSKEDFLLLELLVNAFKLNSPDLDQLVHYLMYFFYFQPKIKEELQKSLTHAIINMILFSRGNFDWEIQNSKELDLVINFWKKIGMDKETFTPNKIFDLLIFKYRLRILNGDSRLLSRIMKVFPKLSAQEFSDISYLEIHRVFYINEFVNGIPDLQGYYAGLEDLLHLDGLSNNKLMKIIAREQNPFCAICKSQEYLEVHHIIPVSCGGTNHFQNLVVVCNSHHSSVHLKESSIAEWPTQTCID
jgi:hypothetical protein